VKAVALAAALVAALATAGALVRGTRGEARRTTFSGVVEAREVDVAAESSARIVSLPADEGAQVSKGAVVAQLDAEELELQAARAQARLDAANAELADLESLPRAEDIALQQARVASARDHLAAVDRELARMRKLRSAGSVSGKAVDDQDAVVDAARWRLETALRELAQTQAGARKPQLDAARSRAAEIARELDLIKLRIARARLVSPVDGIVQRRHHEVGELAQPGKAVLTILDRSQLWIEVMADEKSAGRLAVGQRARAVAEAVPDRPFSATVSFVADRYSFTPRNVETRDERARLTFRVRLRVDQPQPFLKPGMFVEVDFSAPAELHAGR
jgi:HlyD family secretion protein